MYVGIITTVMIMGNYNKIKYLTARVFPYTLKEISSIILSRNSKKRPFLAPNFTEGIFRE